jgi:hypothetical protein
LIRALLVTNKKGCRGCNELEEVGGGGEGMPDVERR